MIHRYIHNHEVIIIVPKNFKKQIRRWKLVFLYLATLQTVCIVIVIIVYSVELIFIPLLLH